MLDEANGGVEDGGCLRLVAEDDRGEALQVAVPLLDQLQLLVAQPEPVLLHLVLAVEVLPVRQLEGEAHRGAPELACDEGGVDLADELEGLLGLGDRVRAVDLLDLLEHLAEPFSSAERLEGLDLLSGRAARPDANAQAAGLYLLAGNLRIPQGKDVAGIGRAHARQDLMCSHVQIGREMGFK